MNLDTFLTVTEKRIPTVPEMVELCNSLGITFWMNGTQPMMKACPECGDEARLLAGLFRREPFRSAVIGLTLADHVSKPVVPAIEAMPTPVAPVVEEAKESPVAVSDEDAVAEQPRIAPPAGARVMIADAAGHINEQRKGTPYMWTWEGAATWYYLKDHPLPSQLQETPR